MCPVLGRSAKARRPKQQDLNHWTAPYETRVLRRNSRVERFPPHGMSLECAAFGSLMHYTCPLIIACDGSHTLLNSSKGLNIDGKPNVLTLTHLGAASRSSPPRLYSSAGLQRYLAREMLSASICEIVDASTHINTSAEDVRIHNATMAQAAWTVAMQCATKQHDSSTPYYNIVGALQTPNPTK